MKVTKTEDGELTVVIEQGDDGAGWPWRVPQLADPDVRKVVLVGTLLDVSSWGSLLGVHKDLLGGHTRRISATFERKV